MPIYKVPKRHFKPAKALRITYKGARKGLNSTFRDEELDPEQAKELSNCILEGEGVVIQKPGSRHLYNAGSSGKVRDRKSVV
jgi:hypothetical protein